VAAGVGANATQPAFVGGGDLIQAISQNDAIFVGSLNNADEFRMNMPISNTGGTATKIVKAFLSDVDATDRIDVANATNASIKDLWTLLNGDPTGHNYSVSDFMASSVPAVGQATVHDNRVLNVTVDTGATGSTADDTVLRVIFMSGISADDYLSAHNLAHYGS
jgi:hypothetical protein